MHVSEVMTPSPFAFRTGQQLTEIIPLMVRSGSSSIPVVDESGTVKGIVSEGDLLRRSEAVRREGGACWAKLYRIAQQAEDVPLPLGRVDDIMTKEVVTIEISDTLADAARLMQTFNVKRLPVTERGRLVGIVARASFVIARI